MSYFFSFMYKINIVVIEKYYKKTLPKVRAIGAGNFGKV